MLRSATVSCCGSDRWCDSGRQSAGGEELEKTSRSRRFRVAAVLPPVGLARFGLVPSQQLPRNVFVSLAALQKLVEQPGKANAILVAADRHEIRAAGDDAADCACDSALRPKLDDYGVRVEELAASDDAAQISADRVGAAGAVVRAADKVPAADAFSRSSLTWPIRSLKARAPRSGRFRIRRSRASIHRNALGRYWMRPDEPIELADDEIVLNRWAADDLEAKVGDTVTSEILRAGEHARTIARARVAAVQVAGDRCNWKGPMASRRSPPTRS